MRGESIERLESRALFSAAPVVTTQPIINTFVAQGASATITAAASGDPTPTVQWEVSLDGVEPFAPITDNASATTDTLVIPDVSIGAEFNEYEAVFTNSQGSVTTNDSTLYVEAPPAIITQPTSQTLPAAGDTATFTAAAVSTTTPTVQWYVESAGSKAFAPITGNASATTPTLTVPDVSASANGSRYEAIFTNFAGSASTVPVALSVPTVSTPPSTPPTAALTTATPLKTARKYYYFTVTYNGSTQIDTAGLNKHDVYATGPDGYEASATFISDKSSNGGKTVAVTYRIAKTGSGFSASSSGKYHIYVRAHQIQDASGNFVVGGILGPFKVAIA